MKIEINFDDIGWLEECEVGEAVNEHFKAEVIRGLQDRLTNKLYQDMASDIRKKRDEVIDSLNKKGEEIVSDFLNNIKSEKLSTMKIPRKETPYSKEVEYVPINEYIGEQYERFLNKKQFDKEGNVGGYGDTKFSMTEILFDKAFGKLLADKVAKTIAEARKKAETEIIGSLENTLQEHLTADIIKKINVPEMLKRLQEKYGEVPEIKA